MTPSSLDLLPRSRGHIAVFCPGLKKGTVLLEGKGHFRARNYILRALLRAELHYEGTFVHGIVIRRKKNYNFIGAIWQPHFRII